jgi:microcystin-dependent protein
LAGNTYTIGEKVGVESVTLTTNQIPIHTHQMIATAEIGALNIPQGNMLAQCAAVKFYSAAAPNTPLNAQAITPAGGSQPHENLQPYLCLSFIISLFGIFPHQ